MISVHDLNIWRLTPQKTLATVRIVFNTTENLLAKYKDISRLFQGYFIDHVTIEPEFVPVTSIFVFPSLIDTFVL